MLEVIRMFEDFYADVYLEMARYGEVMELHVCDNLGEHLVGNVYIKFSTEDEAENCKNNITGRLYAGKLVVPEYSPVTDIREGRCRQFEDGSCKRGALCNFMHLKIVSKEFKKAVQKEMYKQHPEYAE
jgi:splicing factor U2AF 35 kDa subunit